MKVGMTSLVLAAQLFSPAIQYEGRVSWLGPIFSMTGCNLVKYRCKSLPLISSRFHLLFEIIETELNIFFYQIARWKSYKIMFTVGPQLEIGKKKLMFEFSLEN